MPASTLSEFKIQINGTALDPKVYADIRSITVQDDLEALSTLTIVLDNWDQEALELTWSDSTLFDVGNQIEVWLGYVDDLHKVMVAEITSLEPIFSVDKTPRLTVIGYDYRHRLTHGRKTRTFVKMKDSAIVQKVAQEAGLTPKVKDSKVTLPYVVQSNQTDWEFLQSRARRIGYELYVKEKTLYFQPPQVASAAALKLTLAKELLEFSPRLSALRQVGAVTVRGWDSQNKQAIVGKAGAGQELSTMGGETSGPKKTDQTFGKSSAATVDLPVRSKAEADQIALGQFNEMALTYIQGDGLCYGNTQLTAGSVVDIGGAGKTFSGLYYVTSATHTVSPEEGYSTRFTVRRNAT